MQISQTELQRIVAEEYLKEEGILQELTDEQKEEMIAWIKGQGPRPKWATDDAGTSRRGKGVQSPADPNVDRAADTMPFPPRLAQDEEPADASSAGVHPVKAAVDGIYELVSDMDPEDVAEIFQIVFEKLPGVEMSQADVNPGTLYSPGAEGRPQVGFREELINNIYGVLMELDGMGSYGLRSMAGVPGARDEEDEVPEPEETDNIMMNIGNINAYYEKTGKTPSWAKAGLEAMEKRIAAARANAGKYGSVSKHLEEGEYHDMGGEDEMYDTLDPHGFSDMSDAELIDMMHRDGMEEMIILDGEGDLVNREEVIAALKNV